MKAVQVKEGIYWVGALDWHIRNFHGYTTNRVPVPSLSFVDIP